MDLDSAIHAEVLAIREGLFIAAASRWANSKSSVIESNSSNEVSWFLSSSSASWRFWPAIRVVVLRFGQHID